MFDLNSNIAAWRRELIAGGIGTPEALDELETHLRDVFEHLVQAGSDQPAAFKLAVEQLGKSEDLAAEFEKIRPRAWRPTQIATALTLIAVTAMTVLLWRRVLSGRMELLLACHVFAVTLGYSTTLLMGALGICYVCQRWATGFPANRTKSLSRAALLFTGFSAALTVVGVILGAIWAEEHLGRYWAWDVKEVGGIAVIAWLLVCLAVQQCKASTQAMMILSIGGNIVVCLAWFGANLLAAGLDTYGAVGHALAWFLGVNVIFCLVGILPAGALRSRQRLSDRH